MSVRIIYTAEKILVSGLAAVLSYKCINKEDEGKEEDIKPFVLSFFIFFGFMNIIESCIEPFISWIPLFNEAKCILLLSVFVVTTYFHSDVLLKIVVNPLFSFVDARVIPLVVKGCDLLLYYTVVILTPFINQEQLDKMRDYTKKATEEANKKIITNSCVYSINNIKIVYIDSTKLIIISIQLFSLLFIPITIVTRTTHM